MTAHSATPDNPDAPPASGADADNAAPAPAPAPEPGSASESCGENGDAALVMRSARRWFWIAAAAFLVVDLVSKEWLFRALGVPPGAGPGGPYGEPFWLLPGLFRLSACVNDGAAFGLGGGAVMALVAASALLVPALTLMAYSCRAPRTPLWALGMVMGGALGNLYDRIFLGGVRDFFEITHPVTHRAVFAVFNVADVGITVGVVVFLFWNLVLEPRAKSRPAPDAAT